MKFPFSRWEAFWTGPGLFPQVFRVLGDLWKDIRHDDCPGLAAEMAFNWMLALMPCLVFLFSLFGIITSQQALFQRMLAYFHRMVPGDAYGLVQDTLTELVRNSSGELATISLLGALWISSNGALVIEKALNRAYGCTERRRNFWQQRLVALLIMLGMGLILLVFSNLLVFGELLISMIAHWLHPPSWILSGLNALRWLVLIGGFMTISMWIYSIAPESQLFSAWKRTWPGAVVFVTLWALVSLLFSAYVTNMGNYDNVYGPMGAIIILMIWLYLTSYALLIGGEVNAWVNRRDQKTASIKQDAIAAD